MNARKRDRSTVRRDAAVAVVLTVAVAVLLFAARADGGQAVPGPTSRARSAAAAGAHRFPPGWHEVDRPLTGVLLPIQVFAAATYQIVLHHLPLACGPPRAVFREMPPDSVLLQIIEYPPHDEDGRPIRVPRLPRRPDRFSYADATWADYECAGPSYQFAYRQAGRALQAQVWMHRDSVDPRLRRGALQILDHFDPSIGGISTTSSALSPPGRTQDEPNRAARRGPISLSNGAGQEPMTTEPTRPMRSK